MNIKVILSFLSIYIIWGSTFTAIKWGLESFPPFMLSGIRFVIAGLVFFILTKGRGFKNMTGPELRRESLIGFFLTLGNAVVCWSEQYISSGVAALIVGAVPVMFILFNWFGFEKKTPSSSAIIGFGIGILGITIISLDNAAASDWRVVLALLLGNCSWVVGSLLMRSTKTAHTYFTRATVQVGVGGLMMIVLSQLIGERSIQWANIESSALISLLYLAFAGTILAYTCYSYLMRTVTTELASTYALVNPILAILFGIIWFDEAFSIKIALSTTLILVSVFMVLYGDKFLPRVVLKLRTVTAKL